MKRALCLFLLLSLLLLFPFRSSAVSSGALDAAEALHGFGLFNGVGQNEDGSINYDLDRTMTRSEAVTMLVRLLGKENDAKAGSWNIPFTDVADWAKPYVGYAYANGLVKGVSSDSFGGKSDIDATQYFTLLLRALGYSSEIDFQWNRAWELTDKLNITSGQYKGDSPFLRGDAAIVSLSALGQKLKDSSSTLLFQVNGDVSGRCTPYQDFSDVPDYYALNGNNVFYTERSPAGNWFGYVVDYDDDDCKYSYISLLKELGFVNVTDLYEVAGSDGQFWSSVFQNPVSKTEVYVCRDMYQGNNIMLVSINTGTSIEMVNTMRERCNEKVFAVASPVMIINMCADVDSVGGVVWNFDLKNNTEKTIKYATIKWVNLNDVMDVQYDEISGQYIMSLKITGPISSNDKKTGISNANKFYNSGYSYNFSLQSIEIEYMDGTTEKYNKGRIKDYWHQEPVSVFEAALKGYVKLVD